MSKNDGCPPYSFGGWALLACAAVDEVSSGSTMTVMRSGGALRQARLWALATIPRPPLMMAIVRNRVHYRERLREDLHRVARLLQLDDAADIIGAIGGSVPEGFIATLKRLHPEPLETPYDYKRLFAAFEAKDVRAKVLMQVPGQIKASTVRSVLMLDSVTLHPDLVVNIRDARAAEALNAGIALLRRSCSRITDAEIRQSVLSGKAANKPRDWIEDLLLARMDTCGRPHPIAVNDPVFEPLLTGPAFKSASMAMENCLRQRAIFAATGKAHYAITRDHKIALEMRPLINTGLWLVTEARGENNRCLSDREQRECADLFASRGLCYGASPTKADQGLLDAIGVYDLDYAAPFVFED